jgi:peptidyl-prolyl cis-trans isomerase B (cyclophilin B)|tara:strand:- start:466 stop:1122 length:657 start_codon:yes stop_codon:yes gene_type:complete
MHAIKTFGFASLFAPLFILGCASTNTNNTMISDTQPNSLSNTNNQETTMSDMPVVQLETSMGDITIELNEEKAPKTVENFLNYVNSGHYEGTIFHRVIDGFMIQGGGMDAQMNEKKTNAPIENEADNGLKNDKGTIAMARTQDPHSATSQFFINVKDNDFLNHSGKNMQGWGYTVFGKVTDGMDVIEKMRSVATGRFGMHADVPNEPITINSAKVVSQ